MIAGSIALVVAINFLSVRNNGSLDLTEEKLFTLSPKTRKVLEAAENKNITVRVFYRGIQDTQQKRQIQEEFSLYSDKYRHVDVEFIDAYVDSARATEYLKGLAQTNGLNVFVETEDQRIRVNPPFNEQNMAIGFIKATREKKHKIFYVAGHGERSLELEQDEGVGLFKSALEDSGFKVEPFSFIAAASVPEEASVLAIVGPKQPYTQGEIDKIKEFVSKGGKLFVAIDPGESHNLSGLLEDLGVDFKK